MSTKVYSCSILIALDQREVALSAVLLAHGTDARMPLRFIYCQSYKQAPLGCTPLHVTNMGHARAARRSRFCTDSLSRPQMFAASAPSFLRRSNKERSLSRTSESLKNKSSSWSWGGLLANALSTCPQDYKASNSQQQHFDRLKQVHFERTRSHDQPRRCLHRFCAQLQTPRGKTVSAPP